MPNKLVTQKTKHMTSNTDWNNFSFIFHLARSRW
jgi:hypothetical protein